MKNFFVKYKKLHSWLLGLIVFFTLYFSLRQINPLMNVLCGKVIFPLEHFIASLCSYTDVSIAEVLIVSGVCIVLMFVGQSIRLFVKDKINRKTVIYRFVMIVLCSCMSIYAGFCFLWGTSYNTDSFQEQAGLEARGGTIDELNELTWYFTEHLAACADSVNRDENGIFTASISEVLKLSTVVYDELYIEFPFLDRTAYTPKAVTCSYAMSLMDFTGFYFPFTGESNVNVDCPVVYLPATAAHELAHQKGIASEQECNFLSILASTESEYSEFQYSGWLLGYVYLSNALYRVDRDLWREVYNTLPDSVIIDLRYNSAYWAQMQGTVQNVSNKVYDSFLKSNGDENGILTYGTVVDLMLAYYM